MVKRLVLAVVVSLALRPDASMTWNENQPGGDFAAKDFVPVVNLHGATTALSISTNLRMDRRNDHLEEDGEPDIGTAAFVG